MKHLYAICVIVLLLENYHELRKMNDRWQRIDDCPCGICEPPEAIPCPNPFPEKKVLL